MMDDATNKDGERIAKVLARAGVEPGSRLLGEAAAWQLAAEVVERCPSGALSHVRRG